MSYEMFIGGEDKNKAKHQSMRLHLAPSFKSKCKGQKSNTISYQIMLMILMKASGILFKGV